MATNALQASAGCAEVEVDRTAVAYRAARGHHAGAHAGRRLVSKEGPGYSGDADPASQRDPHVSFDHRDGDGADLGVWAGTKDYGVTLRELTGGRWSSAKDVLIDCGLGVMVWILWIGIQTGIVRLWGTSHAISVAALFPQSPIEVALWIVASISAGFAEEIAFRGYFQRQFAAITGSVWAGVVLQGLLFGVGHGYQGLRNVVMITLFGWLYGAVALWRGSLRPGIVTHAWSDIYGGYLYQFFPL